MRLRRRSVWVIVGGLVLGSISFLVITSPRTSGQQNFPKPNRRPACTCFCGDRTFNSFNIFSREDAKAGKCFGGPLGTQACGRMGSGLPAEQRRAICDGLKASRTGSCPAVKAFCGDQSETPKPDCQKPAPWFDSPADCKEVQAPVVAVNNKAITVSICGLPIYRGAPTPPIDEVSLTAYKKVMDWHVQRTMGSKVCCDKVRESARTGNPCFPGVDIDCDGIPNARDTLRDGNIVYPDVNLYTKKNGASVEEFPGGLDPDDPNFLPGPTARDSEGVGDCPCKWELTGGRLQCSSDGIKDHVYSATWKCPANGKEVFTTKYAKATAPCSQPQRAALVYFLNEYSTERPAELLQFLPAALGTQRCGG